ncbi:hypothetical protein Sfri_4027 [Shewanella frigidimarina NCIMB 400]|uniref:Tc1-like transposase DDE domain-containing protein n=1 Tax=Shewanella frigidimarina (strain NCIMB 400) TaxID=318167 RepID=Q07VW2_SHEFN|nr:hypothetical protein Sfri_4027 [Shewanella frigidimarina NCIMB 400]
MNNLNLAALVKSEKSARKRMRYLALLHFTEGHSRTAIANSEYMWEHLTLISEATESGRHALVIMDGAGWHQQDLTEDFDNLSILKLPPYSPELNPIEQVWQWLRQNELANRCFSGYDDIVEQCSIAWNRFIAEPERVIQLCSRRWTKLTN